MADFPQNLLRRLCLLPIGAQTSETLLVKLSIEYRAGSATAKFESFQTKQLRELDKPAHKNP